jgi:hypothetical protein
MSERDDNRMNHFLLLTPEEQASAICRLSRSGMSDHGISSATRLSVEMVRKIIGEARSSETRNTMALAQ